MRVCPRFKVQKDAVRIVWWGALAKFLGEKCYRHFCQDRRPGLSQLQRSSPKNWPPAPVDCPTWNSIGSKWAPFNFKFSRPACARLSAVDFCSSRSDITTSPNPPIPHTPLHTCKMASAGTFVLPGETVDHSLVPAQKKQPLRLGPGLRHQPPADIIPTVAGNLFSDARKNAIWVDTKSGRVRASRLSPLPTGS